MPKEGACCRSLVLHLSVLILPNLFLLLLPCTWSLVYHWHRETTDVLAFLLHELIACRNLEVSQALLISPLHYVFRNSNPHLQFVPVPSQCFNLFLLFSHCCLFFSPLMPVFLPRCIYSISIAFLQ